VGAGTCVALAACSSTPAATSAGGAKLRFTTSPPLSPRFAQSVPDYTVRCASGSVKVSAEVPPGHAVSIDGGERASGTVERDVPLRAGQAFPIVVDSATHYVRCAPSDLPKWRVERHGKPVSQWIAFSPTEREKPPRGAPYSVIADSHGVPVWWAKAAGATPLDATVLPDGSVAWARLGGPFSQTWWDHVALDGSELPRLNTVGEGADHHDLQVLPNGNRLMIAYRRRDHVDLRRLGGPRDATVYDGEVQELTPAGELVWSWSTEGHVKLSETASWRFRKTDLEVDGKPAFDLIHMNSVQYVGGDLVFSGKNVNAVYRVRRSDGRILWKLGGTERPESLKVRRDPHADAPLDAQHDARMHPDGTLSVHDNGTFGHDRLPRVVRYRIRGRTATLVQTIKDRRVGHSYCCGGAQRLRDGRWLIAWGASSIIEEVRRNGKPVLALTLPGKLFSYKAQSVAPGVLTRDALREGMDQQYPR
jgi:hypothetical protein